MSLIKVSDSEWINVISTVVLSICGFALSIGVVTMSAVMLLMCWGFWESLICGGSLC